MALLELILSLCSFSLSLFLIVSMGGIIGYPLLILSIVGFITSEGLRQNKEWSYILLFILWTLRALLLVTWFF